MVEQIKIVTPIIEVQVGRADIAHRHDPNAHPGQVDSHAQLNDLDSDGHPQYALADGSRGEFSLPGHVHSYSAPGHSHAEHPQIVHAHDSAVTVIEHGATATTARGTATVTYWRGTVSPNNALEGDWWHDTTNNALNVKLSGAFVLIGQGA